MTHEREYPISEIFVSPQGEGVWQGTLMAFIRLAGCSVGKGFPRERYLPGDDQLPIYTEMCTTWDGRTFACDTDYRVKVRRKVSEIISEIPSDVQHVCITGGEPFIHNLVPLCYQLFLQGKKIHIETSGTIPIEKAFPNGSDHQDEAPSHWLLEDGLIWITVSPKLGVLPEVLVDADEVKLLVDEKFDERFILPFGEKTQVFIQPINDEWKIRPDNLKRCMELQKSHPNWRISLQLHKILSDYVGEKVR